MSVFMIVLGLICAAVFIFSGILAFTGFKFDKNTIGIVFVSYGIYVILDVIRIISENY